MRIPREPLAIGQVADRLAEIFGTSNVHLVKEPRHQYRWDATIVVGDRTFLLEWKNSGSLARVVQGTGFLSAAKSFFPDGAIALLGVPFMGEAGRNHCAEFDQSWLDLSGNARIIAPGIFYQNLGNKNRFRQPGRPASAFGPRGSRIARRLLIAPERTGSQRAIAQAAGLDEGHTSRVIAKLLADGLLHRDANGIRVSDWSVLLDAWREEYRFDRHQVFPGHVPASGGDELIRTIANIMSGNHISYAATALPAAWLWTGFASFRLATVYLTRPPSQELATSLAFHAGARGANTWLVVPNDDGVFDGAASVNGINCVHPVQVYLDLKGHPERSAEAAENLRSKLAPEFSMGKSADRDT